MRSIQPSKQCHQEPSHVFCRVDGVLPVGIALFAEWRRVLSDGKIYRVRPDKLGTAKSGEKRLIFIDGLPMSVEVL